MLRTIAWYAHFGISLAATIPGLYRVKALDRLGRLEEKEKYVHRIASGWAMAQVKMSGARIKVFGQENIPEDIPVLFVGNHQSNFDIALYMSHINKPKGYIAKIEMDKIPVLRTWMRYLHCVFMDRSSLRKSAEAITEGIKFLKAGHSLVIFPEGTRSKGKEMGEFKAGSFKLATKPKIPIIPVTMSGTFRLMEANGNCIKPADVEIHIHPMIATDTLTKEEEDRLPFKVKEIIASKL